MPAIDSAAFKRVSAPWIFDGLRSISLLVLAGFVCSPIFALNPDEKPVNYITDHWDTENGLPHNSVKQIIQTRDGYLWVGTLMGLARFDGLTFTVFTRNNTPAFVNNQVTSMAETPDGSLWIGTGENLIRYLGGTFTSYTQADGLKDRTINTLCVMPDGSLWIGGREGITRWKDGKFIKDINTSGHPTLGMRNVTVDRNKNVWIAIGTEILRYQNEKITTFGQAEGLPGQQIQIVNEDAGGRIIAVTQNGLFQLEGERFISAALNSGLSSVRVGRTLLDRAGNLWIGTVDGLDRYNDGNVVPYTDRYGRKLGVVDALLEDREGCLWAGTSEGLYRLTDRRASSLTVDDGIPANLVLAIKQTRDQSLWISSWGAGMVRYQNGVATRYTLNAPLSHESVTAIYEGPDSVIWFGNRGSSIDRLEGDKITTYVYRPGVPTSRPVTVILGDDDGTLLIGIASRGLFRLRKGEIEPVPEAGKFTAATVWSLYRDSSGRLFMGTSLGLFERKADRSWQAVETPGLKIPLIVRDFLETDGGMWLATDGNGLACLKEGKLKTYDSHRGMVADTLFTVLDDDEGSFWVSSARGLARIAKKDLEAIDRGAAATVSCLTFGRLDGLASAASSGSGNPAAIRLRDHRILTATDKGVAVVEPHRLQINRQPPTVVIESLLVDDEPLPPSGKIKLEAGAGRLEIRYTALSLISPQRLRFRYKLEGSDARWVEAGSDRRAYYTNLAPGDYTFRVLACNNDGVWSDTGASIALTKLPHFYETTPFRLLGLTLIVALISVFIRVRGRQLQQKQIALTRMNTQLDQRVRERTAELSQSHEELQMREQLFRLIFEHAPVGISWKRADLGSNYHFNATFRRILELPALTLPDFSSLTAMLHPDDAPRHAELRRQVESGQTDHYTVEQRYIRQDGNLVWGMLSVAVIRDPQGRVTQDIGILEDITARKKAEQEVGDTYKNLVEVSRTAGMAEVATGVLHNVGNVLNSLNVSADVISLGLKQSKIESVAKLGVMLHEHSGDLVTFLTLDPKGKRIPEYIESLARHLLEERARLLGETESLQHNVDHIKEIVSMQQAYATVVSAAEPLDAASLMDDALRMNSTALTRHDVQVTREFQLVAPVLAEKAKVIQILINLIRNAKEACSESANPQKEITVAIEPGSAGRVRMSVRDNGMGIAPENLNRIFAHGFTTRKNGHGFGLHSAANAAREMEGSLTATSSGPNMGATFTLELPDATTALETATAA